MLESSEDMMFSRQMPTTSLCAVLTDGMQRVKTVNFYGRAAAPRFTRPTTATTTSASVASSATATTTGAPGGAWTRAAPATTTMTAGCVKQGHLVLMVSGEFSQFDLLGPGVLLAAPEHARFRRRERRELAGRRV